MNLFSLQNLQEIKKVVRYRIKHESLTEIRRTIENKKKKNQS